MSRVDSLVSLKQNGFTSIVDLPFFYRAPFTTTVTKL